MQRTFSILGDSISTFDGCNPAGFAVFYQGDRCSATGVRSPGDTWWKLLVDELGGTVIANASFSGSLVSGGDFPSATAPERIEALRGVDGQAPQVVVIFMGINDFGRGAAVEDFSASYDLLLARLACTYPTSEVWCCTVPPARLAGAVSPTFTWRLHGMSLGEYNHTIARAAQRHGCRLVDMCGLGFDYEALDGTHPTREGMGQIAQMALACLREGEASPDLGMRSRDWCPDASCQDCPWALDTSYGSWRCVCTKPHA